MKNRQLKRDHVVSSVDGRDLVGIYMEFNTIDEIINQVGTQPNGKKYILLSETSPGKANKILKLWNLKEDDSYSENE